MTQRGRILFVASSYPRYQGDPTATFIRNLAVDLAELGWSIDVLVPHAPSLRRSEVMDGLAIRRFRYFLPESEQTVCYGSGALINLRTSPLNYLKLPALIASQWAAVTSSLARAHYDLVHSHWILPQALTAGIAAHLRNVPHIATAHGGDVFALQGGALGAVKRLALRFADAVTVNSSVTEGVVQSLTANTAGVHVIPMGATDLPPQTQREIDAIAELKRTYARAGGPLLIFVGRLIDEKGVADLLRAVQILAKTHPNTSLVVVGEGQDRAKFESLASELGITPRTAFVGKVPNDQVPLYLRASDVFVAPSVTSTQGWVEAQGVTIAEAMLAGLPVVATRSGGIVDSIRDNVSGLLVREHSPNEIATAIIKLHESSELRATLTQAAKRVAQLRYTRSASASAFSDLYEQVISRR